MKIGILTFHRPSNFGANLQAYSSVCYFKSLGHDVKVIDYIRPSDIGYKDSVDAKQFEAHKHFVESRLPMTVQVMDEDGLTQVVADEKFDVILIGADAVWRSPKDNNIFFAEWLFKDDRIRDIAVCSISAAHMGIGFTDQRAEGIKSIHDCLTKFKYITVRDSWTRDVLNRDIFGGENFVKVVNPDPVTMLSLYTDSEAWISHGQEAKKYYLLSLPKNWAKEGKTVINRRKWFNAFKKCVNETGYKLIEFPIPEGKSGFEFDGCVEYPIDPIQWFLWIKNAKAFCGLRFHAIVHSMSKDPPFYSIDSYGNRDKYNVILDMIGLHTIARSRDQKSKIRNLLKDTSFESHRTGAYIEFEDPKKVFKKLEYCMIADVIKVRDNYRKIFTTNMSELFKLIEK